MLKHLFITFSLIFTLLLSASETQAQDSLKRELGLRLTSLDSFGFIYKQQKKNNVYWRFRGAFLSVNSSNNSTVFQTGMAVGLEKKEDLTESLQFLHGFEPRLSLASVSETMIVTPGIGYILGFQYTISDKFFAGLEAVPGMDLVINSSSESFNQTILNAGFNSSSVALTFLHRF